VLTTIAADDGSCPAVPRGATGHDGARLAAVLRALLPYVAPCTVQERAIPTALAASVDAPWAVVAPVLALADEELAGVLRFEAPLGPTPSACVSPRTLAQLSAASAPSR
jgi:hypothetical protein